MTQDELRAHVALREGDPLSLRPERTDESWGIPKDEPKFHPSPLALAFITASHSRVCDCVHCECGR